MFDNPNNGRWLSRDPIGEPGGINLYGFSYNAPISQVDPLGLKIYVKHLKDDPAGFEERVRAAFQKIIGDCAKLHVSPVFVPARSGFLWRNRTHKLVGWEIYATDEKANCTCSPCWKHLKDALGLQLPSHNITIMRYPYTDNAGASANGYVAINEDVTVRMPTLDEMGNVVWEVTPFEVVLWHEAIGHAHLGLGHPSDPENNAGSSSSGPKVIGNDPTIMEENNARNCLRLQGVTILDRVTTYWGWGQYLDK